MDVRRLRAWRFERQGLPSGMRGAAPEAVIERTGWVRSVAGVNPYLTLFSRAGISREAADRAVATGEICELPAARGCTYVTPRSEYALALKLGQGSGEAADIRTAKKYLGVTEEEIDRLSDLVLQALADGPRDPSELKEELGDAVRSLGPEGKKRGVGTTLPMVLGRLQAFGEIRRQPMNGRLDQQRYRYTRWTDNPLKAYPFTLEEAAIALAERYFRWIGPATVAQFQAFSGLGAKAAKAAIEPLRLVPLETEGSLLTFPEDKESIYDYRTPSEPRYALVSSMDGVLLHRRDVLSELDPEDRGWEFATADRIVQMGSLQELHHHAILDRGRIVGLWEYEVASQSIVWASFTEPDAAMKAEVARTEEFVRDQLGDARSFSLDSPESRAPKLAGLRQFAPARR